jgi:hypothetical protein
MACNDAIEVSSTVKIDSMELEKTDNQVSVIIADTSNPDELLNIIRRLQKKYVRDSWGKLDYECFTEVDLEKFNNEGILFKIVTSLEKDKGFKSLTERIGRMPIAQRADLLNRAENTYKRTWSQLNFNPNTSSREQLLTGQTEAGTKAEKSIAETVVSSANRQINQ